ncbi:hypothetical protein GCM10028806_51170 [Spirosoma terrae]|uniref:Uncharacterized protein n=1 Tax=Spirosoma terrae TaxID=1968276 RepID=A0A6L9LBD6_9BACT|nr:hypothetical protein [Spirosoma terrae]NDU96471.1 hypothetical protein [Spirosoma terrae]
MESPMGLSAEQIVDLLGPNASIWPLLTDNAREELSKIFSTTLADREAGLLELETVDNNDCLEASMLRATFHESVVEPILAPHATRSNHYDPKQSDYKGTTGYVIGINQFRAVATAFADSEAVQICFGMDKPLGEGGQLQLIFKGIGGLTNPNVVFITGKPGAGNGPDGARVRPCPSNGQC